jgi:hypothetical protein
MDFESSARLRREWTGKSVMLAVETPRLARFAGRTGVVRTVNQNGKALVEFEGTDDIGWYDISPEHLRLVEAESSDTPAAEGA